MNLINRKHRRRRDSTELKNNRYAVASSNDNGIGDKDSLDCVPGIKYLQGQHGSKGSESLCLARMESFLICILYNACYRSSVKDCPTIWDYVMGDLSAAIR